MVGRETEILANNPKSSCNNTETNKKRRWTIPSKQNINSKCANQITLHQKACTCVNILYIVIYRADDCRLENFTYHPTLLSMIYF